MPIYYVEQLFEAAGLNTGWDGTNWTIQSKAVTSGVAGFVSDGTNPLKGATVSVAGKTATTDANGYYHLEGIAPGKYDVTVTDLGYVTSKVSNLNVLTDSGSSVGVTLTKLVKSNIVINATVVNASTGAPVSGADVLVEANNQTNGTWSQVATTTTASDGTFSITNANGKLDFGGQYRVTVSKDYNKSDKSNMSTGFVKQVRTITLATDSNTNVLSGFQLQQVKALNITGTVKNAAGTDTDNVQLFDQDGTTELASTTASSTDGSFSFNNLTLPTGKYSLRVNNGTDAIYTKALNVTEGTNLNQTVQLVQGHNVTMTLGAQGLNDQFAAGTYTVKVVDASGVVVNSAPVTLANAASTITFPALAQIPSGSYSVVVSGDYIQTASFPLTVSTTDATPSGRANLAGAVSGSVGVSGATVQLLDASSNKVVASTTADTTGAYQFVSLAPGSYEIAVQANGYTAGTSSAFTVSASQTATENLTLSAVPTTAQAAGFVRESGTLAPVSGATVSYYAVAVDGVDAGTLVKTANVSGSGDYTVSDLTPGAYNVVVRGANHETLTTPLTVAAGDDLQNQNYSLQTGGNATLNIKVQDASAKAVTPTSVALVDAYGKTVASTANVTGLSAGQYTLNISAAGYNDLSQQVTVTKGSTGTLTAVMQPTAAAHSVSIRVLDASNANVSGAEVGVFDNSGNLVKTSTTDANGTASVSLQDGSYTVKVFNNGDVVSQSSVTVAGQDVTIPAIQLKQY